MPLFAYETPWMNEELKLFRSTGRKFIQTTVIPHYSRRIKQRRPDPDVWLEARNTGLLFTDVTRGYRGDGGSFAHKAVVLEELARGSAVRLRRA